MIYFRKKRQKVSVSRSAKLMETEGDSTNLSGCLEISHKTSTKTLKVFDCNVNKNVENFKWHE